MSRLSLIGAGGLKAGTDALVVAVQESVIKAPAISYPTASLTGVERSPFVKVVPEVGTLFVVAHRHTNMTSVANGTDIIMDHADVASDGGISINTSTGVITLPAGHVFRLEGAFYATQFSASTAWARYAFINADDNLPFAGVAAWHAVVIPDTGTNNECPQPTAGVILETHNEMRVKLRVTAGSGTHTMRSDSSYICVTKIGSGSMSYSRSKLRALITKTDGTVALDTTLDAGKNYARYSDDLTDATWVKGAGHTAAALANGLGYSRLTTGATGDDLTQTLQDSYLSIKAGVLATASIEFILESTYTNIRLKLGISTDAIYADFNPATETATSGVIGAGVLNASPHTIEKLAPGHFRLTVRGTPKPNDTTNSDILTITPTSATAGASLIIGSVVVTDGTVASPVHIATTGRILGSAIAPRCVSGSATALDPLTEYDMQVQDVALTGAKTALSSKIRFTTGLRAQLNLTGVGASSWVELMVGESVNSVGAAFHLRGKANTFPTAAGDGGSLLFANRRGGSAVQFHVISVSGTTPNRVARIALLTDAASSVYVDDTAGSNQATALAPATGGTITQIGDDYLHTFNASGTFTPTVAVVARVLLVGGGGGGAHGTAAVNYGAGGAGGVVRTDIALSLPASTAVAVTVGAGGAGGTAATAGGSTIFGAYLTATGGNAPNPVAGRTGGNNADFSGETGAAENYTSGGGAGAGQNAGVNGSSRGGNGVSNDITGTATYYGGGGGGVKLATGQAGGLGGGGSGIGGAVTSANIGTANTGGGGGGAATTGGGGGGSGVVIVRFPMWSARTRHTAAFTALS